MADMIQMEMYFFDTFHDEMEHCDTIIMEMFFFTDFELEQIV